MANAWDDVDEADRNAYIEASAQRGDETAEEHRIRVTDLAREVLRQAAEKKARQAAEGQEPSSPADIQAQAGQEGGTE